jgi:hypothetical protein
MNKSFSSLLHLMAFSTRVSGMRSSEVKSITFGFFDLNLSSLQNASTVYVLESSCFASLFF